MIREKKPTAVLMEALMSGLDGLGVLMAVSRGECGVQPTIFTMTGMDAPGITNQLIRAAPPITLSSRSIPISLPSG